LIINNFAVEEIFDLGLNVFEGVVVESIIFRFKIIKTENENTLIRIDRERIGNDFSIENEYSINLYKYYKQDKSFNINLTNELDSIIIKCQNENIELGKIAYCTVGINTGYIKEELTSKTQIDNTYHKMLNGKNIGRNFVEWDNEWIMYNAEFVKSKGDRGRSLPPEYIFREDKILVQRTRRGMKRKLVCYFDCDQHYNLNRLSNIVLTNKNYCLKYIYILLNSELLDFYFNKYFNEYEVKPVHLAKLPIRILDIEAQQPFITKADIMLSRNKDLQHSNTQFQKLLSSKFSIININTKLDKWYTLSFADFSKELTKQKIKLSLQDQSEWLTFFEQEKQKAMAIKNEIDATDKEIDRMVYALYGLNEEEIKIVEGN
jgi:TaqI-like C-terminal specificity domain